MKNFWIVLGLLLIVAFFAMYYIAGGPGTCKLENNLVVYKHGAFGNEGACVQHLSKGQIVFTSISANITNDAAVVDNVIDNVIVGDVATGYGFIDTLNDTNTSEGQAQERIPVQGNFTYGRHPGRGSYTQSEIPEFGVMTAIIALAGAAGIILYRREK